MLFVHKHESLNLQDKKWDKEAEADVVQIVYGDTGIGRFVYDKHGDRWGINLNNTVVLSQTAIGAAWALLWYKLDHPKEGIVGSINEDRKETAMRTIRITPEIVVVLGDPDPRSTAPHPVDPMRHPYVLSSCIIESAMERDTCGHCDHPDCCYSCDMSVAQIEGCLDGQPDSEDQVATRLKSNGALDGIEAIILALAAAGFDVGSSAFEEAVKAACDGLGNNT